MSINGGRMKLQRLLLALFVLPMFMSCVMIQFLSFDDGSTYKRIVTDSGHIVVTCQKNSYLMFWLNGRYKVNPDSLRWMFDTDKEARLIDTAYVRISCDTLPGSTQQRVVITMRPEVALKFRGLKAFAPVAKPSRLYLLPSSFIVDGSGNAITDTIKIFLSNKAASKSGAGILRKNIVESDFYKRVGKRSGIQKISEKGNFRWKNVSTFNREGRVERERSVLLLFGKLKSDCCFSYNAIGDSVLEIRKVDIVNKNVAFPVARFSYDVSGLCRKVTYYYENHKGISSEKYLTWRNDSLVECVCKNPDGKTEYRTVYSFDGLRNAVTEATYFGNSHIATIVTTYSYDDQNRLTAKTVENFDKPGLPNLMFSLGNTIKYDEHDSHGNWLKSYYMTDSYGRMLCAKRCIKYYK